MGDQPIGPLPPPSNLEPGRVFHVKPSDGAVELVCTACGEMMGAVEYRAWVGGKPYHPRCNPFMEQDKMPEQTKPALEDCVDRVGGETATAMRVAKNLISKGWIEETDRSSPRFGPMDRAFQLIECIKECL